MRMKDIVYKLLQRLSNTVGYNIIITRKSDAPDAPYKRNLQDGLMSVHSNEFLIDEKFINAYERAVKAANGIDHKVQWRVHVALWAAHTCSRIEG